MKLYHVRKVKSVKFGDLLRVEKILHRCGKDMAEKYGLLHWNNSHFKNAAVVALCILKNTIYLVCNREGEAVATFQIKKVGNTLLFQKLATDPIFSGKGIGSFCIETIENIAKKAQCQKVCCEVYDQSLHAIDFYKHRGYQVCGNKKTLKYTQILMEKLLEN